MITGEAGLTHSEIPGVEHRSAAGVRVQRHDRVELPDGDAGADPRPHRHPLVPLPDPAVVDPGELHLPVDDRLHLDVRCSRP